MEKQLLEKTLQQVLESSEADHDAAAPQPAPQKDGKAADESQVHPQANTLWPSYRSCTTSGCSDNAIKKTKSCSALRGRGPLLFVSVGLLLLSD